MNSSSKNSMKSMTKSAMTNVTRFVSKNFYKSLSLRIAATSDLTGIDPAEVMRHIDLYITDGVSPESNLPTAIMLIFRLMQPEIDKAVARSKAARLRAKNRKGRSSKELLQNEREFLITASSAENAINNENLFNEVIGDDNSTTEIADNESKRIRPTRTGYPRKLQHSIRRKFKFPKQKPHKSR